MQCFGELGARGVEEEAETCSPGRISDLSDTLDQGSLCIVAVVDRDGVLNIARADRVGQQLHMPCVASRAATSEKERRWSLMHALLHSLHLRGQAIAHKLTSGTRPI